MMLIKNWLHFLFFSFSVHSNPIQTYVMNKLGQTLSKSMCNPDYELQFSFYYNLSKLLKE